MPASRILVIASARPGLVGFVVDRCRAGHPGADLFILATSNRREAYASRVPAEQLICLATAAFTPEALTRLPDPRLQNAYQAVYIALNDALATGYEPVFRMCARLQAAHVYTIDVFGHRKTPADFALRAVPRIGSGRFWFRLAAALAGGLWRALLYRGSGAALDRRTILFLDYYFPPLGGTGMHRCLHLVENVRQGGYRPLILTADEAAARHFPFPEFAEAKRWRTAMPGGIIRAPFFLLAQVRNPRPDPHVGWLPALLAAGAATLRRDRPGLIVATCPPYTSAVAGWILSVLFGVPLVVDYRDLWLENTHFRSRLTWLDRWLEPRINARAAAILTISEFQRELLVRRQPHLAARINCIPRGHRRIRPGEIEPFPLQEPGRRLFRLAYTGIFYGGSRSPRIIFAALAALVGAGQVARDEIAFELAGPFDETVLEHGRAAGLADRLHFYGTLPQARTLHLQASSEILFHVEKDEIPEDRCIMTGKIFEYLAHGKFILAVAAPDGALARFVREARLGAVFGHGDGEALRALILDKYREWQRTGAVAAAYRHDVLDKTACENLAFRRLVEELR